VRATSTTSDTPGTVTRIRAHPISWIMLLITTLAILITSIDRIILPTVLPGISNEFHLDATEGGVLVSLSFVGTFIGALAIGVAGDLLGRGHRRAWTWVGAVLVTGVSAVATAVTSSLAALRAWRVAMGIGTAVWNRSTLRWWPSGGHGSVVDSRPACTTPDFRSANCSARC
jgi:MFS family permease